MLNSQSQEILGMSATGVAPLPYTCITCRVAFRDLEIQRQHYKSDWHRYNLKRKVAELPPVAVEDFQKRVIAQRGHEDRSRVNEETTISCKTCHKSFSTRNQLENHVLSRKHKDKALRNEEEEERRSTHEDKDERTVEKDERMKDESERPKVTRSSTKVSREQPMDSEDSDVETIDSDEWNENRIDNNDCLFCNNHSRSLTRNLKHMSLAHSFFIPDPEYCVDPKGLLVYLGEKIYDGWMCVWCNETGKAFQSAEAARAHMLDKGHCKMRHEGESLAEYADFYDYSSSYPDDQVDPDAEITVPDIVDSNDFQLVLPSGHVIGHRSLLRYYKQSIDPNRSLAVPRSEKLRKVMSQYRAIGWSETEKAAVLRKARDIKYMQRIQAKYTTKLQFKANKFQPHYRPQVNY